MRCPACGEDDDKVVESRAVDGGAAIRRRRACLACSRRYTTFERIEEVPLVVVKSDGRREPFDRAKIVAGVQVAAKDRPVDADAIEVLASEVEEEMRSADAVTTQDVGRAVLDRLRHLDGVTAVRFASVYKGFDSIDDFEREVRALVKRPGRSDP